MFSAIFSRLRLPGVAPTQGTNQDDNDDASSMNRSLNLPWPVTESSLRRGPSSASAQGVTISNPIPRATPISLTGFGYDEHATAPPVYASNGNARQTQGGPSMTNVVSPPGAWYEPPEKPRVRRLYPPPEVDVSAPVQTQGQAAALAPPAVVRLDSETFAAASADNREDQDEEEAHPPTYAYTYTSHPPSASAYAVPYPDSRPYPSPVYTNPAAASSSHSPQRSHDSWNEPTPRANPARLPHHSSPDLDRQVDDRELYTSPFESDFEQTGFPMPPKSTTSSSAPENGNGGASGGSMTKSRWGLKLQLQQSQMAPASMPSLPVSGNHSQQQATRHTHPTHVQRHTGVQTFEPNEGVGTDVYKSAYNYPLAKQLSPIVEQDYISPTRSDSESRSVIGLGKSVGTGAGSKQNSARASPGVESIVGSLARGKSRHGVGEEMEDDRASLRTRTGSANSIRTVSGNVGGNTTSLSRSGSLTLSADASAIQKGVHAATLSRGGNGSVGSGKEKLEIARPSPIHPSPFINRHLNRTVSQTSSKSDCQAPPSQTPSQSQTHTPVSSQPPTPGITARVPIALLSTTSPSPRATACPTTNATANNNGGITVQTPTSAGTTGSTTTATMFTPTSTLQTPTSATVIQHPPGAIVASTAPTATGPSEGVMPLPKIPAVSPIELRYSMFGSVSPRADRSSRMARTSIAGSTLKGGVDRMPVIAGSVEGYYEDEDEEEEDAEEGEEGEEDYEEEEYDRESLHAESFVTAGTNDENVLEDDKGINDPNGGVELATLGKYSHTVRPASPGGSSSVERLPPGARRDSERPSRGPSRSASRTGAQIAQADGRATPGSGGGESFIDRRWERDAGFGLSSSPTTFRVRARYIPSRWPFRSLSSGSSFTAAFWAFWLGFLCPMLWLVGGWHFTNAGEMPPKYTVWEWYFWKRRWSVRVWCRTIGSRLKGAVGLCTRRRQGKKDVRESEDSGVTFAEPQQEPPQRRNKGKRRSDSHSKLRDAKVYPSLPRWVAERQSTDDGRMKLNDPKRTLRGISFGYPFIPRTQMSQGSLPDQSSSLFYRLLRAVFELLGKPNRILDQLYGVKLKEVRGRPESGRRMFDPWIQRCRYAFCWALLLIAIGLCVASVFLIIVNTKRLAAA
ncbi:unnamed protein product [Cyclocybe aegerita]|uniref:Uncharacterized protein n=1 Tax=Cyclocybe aegerita TaxID=1973307 RepID=A0A8S0WSK5_CYCAE|nr:unnamed protein product [Cyclocybe aegerita]